MGSPPKILCVVAHGYYQPWIDILFKGQELTWLSENRAEKFQVLHFHATPVGNFLQRFDKLHERVRWTRSRIISRLLISMDCFITFPFIFWTPKVSKSELINLKDPAINAQVKDMYLTFPWKLIAMYKYALKNYEFDYLFRTTSSSYVRTVKLSKFTETLPRKKYYGGAIAYEGATFAAGNNVLMSRDLVEKIVSKKVIINPTIIEDVSLGNYMESIGIELSPLPQINIDSIKKLNSISDEELIDNFHFRLRSGSMEKRNDIEIMHALHQRISKINRNK
jgi:hypothetical protein